MLSVGQLPLSFATLEDALSANISLRSRYTVVLSLGMYKHFGLLLGPRHILEVPKEMCLVELVLGNSARPFIDFDSNVKSSIPAIEASLLSYYMKRHRVHVTIAWKWSDSVDLRWHCVVSGVYYKGCWSTECEDMVQQLVSEVPDLVVDRGLYRERASSLRMVGQCKYHRGTYVRRLMPLDNYEVEDLCISPTAEDICLGAVQNVPCIQPRSSSLSPDPLGVGASRRIVRKQSKDAHQGDQKGTAREVDTATEGTSYVLESMSLALGSVPSGMRLGSMMSTEQRRVAFRLDRVGPSYCAICSRVHHRENGMIVVSKSIVEVRCFRNVNRVLN